MNVRSSEVYDVLKKTNSAHRNGPKAAQPGADMAAKRVGFFR